MEKQKVHQLVLEQIQNHIDQLSFMLIQIQESSQEDSKSSAGDKHETARAMVQIEIENINKQLSVFIDQRQAVLAINPSIQSTKITKGSLVQTNLAWYYFAVGLGKLMVDKELVFVLNPQAPLGQILLGKKAGDCISFKEQDIEILSIQ